MGTTLSGSVQPTVQDSQGTVTQLTDISSSTVSLTSVPSSPILSEYCTPNTTSSITCTTSTTNTVNGTSHHHLMTSVGSLARMMSSKPFPMMKICSLLPDNSFQKQF